MNRYFYYPFAMGMITNTILFVPNILINDRFSGAIPAMLLSVIISSLLTYLFTKAMVSFPGEGLPEIFAALLPKWAGNLYLIFLACMWFDAGGMVLVSYSRVIQRYVIPDFNLYILIGFLGLVCSWAASNNSRTVLYMTEVVLVLNSPLIFLILFKAMTNANMDWDAVRMFTHYSLEVPSWRSLAASTYLFTGYINWAIFNRSFRINASFRHLWLIPLTGTVVLLTTFLIPIGYHGTVGVDQFTYTWASTADSMRMEFGFVERVLFVYLLLYLSIALIFITITWHVGAELLKATLPQRIQPVLQKHTQWSSWIILVVVLILSECSAGLFNEKIYLTLASSWFQLRLPSEIILVAIVYWLGKKRKRRTA